MGYRSILALGLLLLPGLSTAALEIDSRHPRLWVDPDSAAAVQSYFAVEGEDDWIDATRSYYATNKASWLSTLTTSTNEQYLQGAALRLSLYSWLFADTTYAVAGAHRWANRLYAVGGADPCQMMIEPGVYDVLNHGVIYDFFRPTMADGTVDSTYAWMQQFIGNPEDCVGGSTSDDINGPFFVYREWGARPNFQPYRHAGYLERMTDFPFAIYGDGTTEQDAAIIDSLTANMDYFESVCVPCIAATADSGSSQFSGYVRQRQQFLMFGMVLKNATNYETEYTLLNYPLVWAPTWDARFLFVWEAHQEQQINYSGRYNQTGSVGALGLYLAGACLDKDGCKFEPARNYLNNSTAAYLAPFLAVFYRPWLYDLPSDGCPNVLFSESHGDVLYASNFLADINPVPTTVRFGYSAGLNGTYGGTDRRQGDYFLYRGTDGLVPRQGWTYDGGTWTYRGMYTHLGNASLLLFDRGNPDDYPQDVNSGGTVEYGGSVTTVSGCDEFTDDSYDSYRAGPERLSSGSSGRTTPFTVSDNLNLAFNSSDYPDRASFIGERITMVDSTIVLATYRVVLDKDSVDVAANVPIFNLPSFCGGSVDTLRGGASGGMYLVDTDSLQWQHGASEAKLTVLLNQSSGDGADSLFVIGGASNTTEYDAEDANLDDDPYNWIRNVLDQNTTTGKGWPRGAYVTDEADISFEGYVRQLRRNYAETSYTLSDSINWNKSRRDRHLPYSASNIQSFAQMITDYRIEIAVGGASDGDTVDIAYLIEFGDSSDVRCSWATDTEGDCRIAYNDDYYISFVPPDTVATTGTFGTSPGTRDVILIGNFEDGDYDVSGTRVTATGGMLVCGNLDSPDSVIVAEWDAGEGTQQPRRRSSAAQRRAREWWRQ